MGSLYLCFSFCVTHGGLCVTLENPSDVKYYRVN